jgi:hypothetical protein
VNNVRSPTASPGLHASVTSRVLPWLVGLIFAGLAARHLAFVNAHATNILYWDEWDFFQPLFRGDGWWATFDLQHGPHRQGVGLVLTRAMAMVSGWDSRWDALAASSLMIGAAGLGILLARRFGIPRHSLVLAAVPLLFLNVHQYESFVGAVNLSYASVPMLLFTACCLSWFLEDRLWRLLAIAALTILLIFSGFGLFAGLISPPLVAIEAVQAWRAKDRAHAAMAIASLAIMAAGWAAFGRGYTFQPAVPGFRFPYEHPMQYFVFVGRILGNFYGTPVLSAAQLVLGLAAAAALVAISAWNGMLFLKKGVSSDPRAAVLFSMSTFALLFCANCAVGRVFTGSIAPLASRYASLLIPGGMAILLQLAVLPARGVMAWLALAYAVLLVPGTAFLRSDEVYGINWYSEGKRAWKAAYLSTHDEAKADQIANFHIYPFPLGTRLTYLEDRRLNLFLPDAP